MGLYPDSLGLLQAGCLVVWPAAGAQGGLSAGFPSTSCSELELTTPGNDVVIELALFWPQQYLHAGWVKLRLSHPVCTFALLTQTASACSTVLQW